jgi:hypothetical protein
LCSNLLASSASRTSWSAARNRMAGGIAAAVIGIVISVAMGAFYKLVASPEFQAKKEAGGERGSERSAVSDDGW